MWNWDYAISVTPKLLASLKVTFYATFWGFLIACVFGLFLSILGRSRHKAVRLAVNGFVEFIRSTPLLVQLFFLFFGLPMLLGFSMSAFVTGVIGLGLHYSTYMSEVYRSGIDGVEKGQWEAARALNFSKSRTWTSIVLPQAIPPILPIMGNYLIVMFKETPLLMGITVVELLTTAKNINARDWRSFETFTIIGIVFLIISLLVSMVVGIMERKISKRHSR